MDGSSAQEVTAGMTVELTGERDRSDATNWGGRILFSDRCSSPHWFAYWHFEVRSVIVYVQAMPTLTDLIFLRIATSLSQRRKESRTKFKCSLPC